MRELLILEKIEEVLKAFQLEISTLKRKKEFAMKNGSSAEEVESITKRLTTLENLFAIFESFYNVFINSFEGLEERNVSVANLSDEQIIEPKNKTEDKETVDLVQKDNQTEAQYVFNEVSNSFEEDFLKNLGDNENINKEVNIENNDEEQKSGDLKESIDNIITSLISNTQQIVENTVDISDILNIEEITDNSIQEDAYNNRKDNEEIVNNDSESEEAVKEIYEILEQEAADASQSNVEENLNEISENLQVNEIIDDKSKLEFKEDEVRNEVDIQGDTEDKIDLEELTEIDEVLELKSIDTTAVDNTEETITNTEDEDITSLFTTKEIIFAKKMLEIIIENNGTMEYEDLVIRMEDEMKDYLTDDDYKIEFGVIPNWIRMLSQIRITLITLGVLANNVPMKIVQITDKGRDFYSKLKDYLLFI